MCSLSVALLLVVAQAEVDDPLAKLHERKDPTHVLSVLKVDGAIEDIRKGTVQVFGSRQELACHDGSLVATMACDPCTYKLEEWAERPADVWLYDMEWKGDSAESRSAAAARLAHFQKYFELTPRGGGEKGGQRHLFYAYTGRRMPPPPPAVAMRVRFFIEGKESSAAVIPFGSREVMVEARAQKKNEKGSLVEFPEATVAFSATCGTVREAGAGKVLYSLENGVGRCELKAIASPGAATATLGVRREVQIEITYEDQAVDEVVLEGDRKIELGLRARGEKGDVTVTPDWKAESGTLEMLEPRGTRVRFTLDKGATEGSVLLLDSNSGAGDRVVLRARK